MRKKEIVEAINRCVYFKDEPVSLDKGKYANRLELLKVPRLTKERILRVAPENIRLYSFEIILKSGQSSLSNPHIFNYLINTVSILAEFNTFAGTHDFKLDYYIYHFTDKENQSLILYDYLYKGSQDACSKSTHFLPTKAFQIGFINNSSKDLKITYDFYYSENLINDNNNYNTLINNEQMNFLIQNPIKQWNAVSILLEDLSTINTDIDILVYVNYSTSLVKIHDLTITTGTTYYNTFYIPTTCSLSIRIKNNKVSGLKALANLFFSNSFQNRNNALNLYGIENSAWIPCTFEATLYAMTNIKGGVVIQNTGSNDEWVHYVCPLPTNKGIYKLYIKGVKIDIKVADATDYVTHVRAYARNSSGNLSLLNDGTNRTATGTYTYAFATVNVSSYFDIVVYIMMYNTTTGQLQLGTIMVDCYYK